MNWKQFGKAQMLTKYQYNENLYYFMNEMHIDYRFWELRREHDNAVDIFNGFIASINYKKDEIFERMKREAA